jgi:protein-tyrosine kinase
MSILKKALQKAKEARGEILAVKPLAADPAPPPPSLSERKHADQTLRIAYSCTQVLHADPDVLRTNRVVSVCTEDEADRLKILRTRIVDLMRSEGKNTLLVTSANAGEGKTLTAINLAISFSHLLNQTVLLVDAHLKNPSVHRYFGFDEKEGLSDYLRGKKEISDLLVCPGLDRLVLLPGGKRITNSAELLGTTSMESLVGEIKTRYPDRFILFDGGPILTSADPLVLARYTDGILLVVEAERTTRNDLKRVFELLKDRPVVGMVLNKCRE